MLAVRHAALLAALACGGCIGEAASSSGQVLDWSTHRAIPGARVTLECTKRSPMQIEGEVIARTVTRTTDTAGRYSFSVADRRGCYRTFIWASKAGYADANSQLMGGRIAVAAPGMQYLVRDSEQVWFELQRITPPSTMVATNPNGTTSISATYVLLFMPFFEAKRIASTPREVAFVHERFCPTLQALYAKLTDDERAHVAKLGVTYSFRGKYESGTLDHAELSSYCDER
jgi:hypothetical protein